MKEKRIQLELELVRTLFKKYKQTNKQKIQPTVTDNFCVFFVKEINFSLLQQAGKKCLSPQGLISLLIS